MVDLYVRGFEVKEIGKEEYCIEIRAVGVFGETTYTIHLPTRSRDFKMLLQLIKEVLKK